MAQTDSPDLEAAAQHLYRLLGPLQVEDRNTGAVLKPHAYPQLAGSSLLSEILEQQHLSGEFAQLLAAMRNETDRADSPLMHPANPFRLQEVNYVMYHPLALPLVARQLSDRLPNCYNGSRHDLDALLQVALDELDTPAAVPPLQPVGNWPAYLVRLVNTIASAQRERQAVLAALTDEERDFLFAAAPQLLLGDGVPSQRELSGQQKADDEARWLHFFRIAAKLDLKRLLYASLNVARAIDLDMLQRLANQPLMPFPANWMIHRRGKLTELATPAGKVLIGGKGDNLYDEEAALIIDLGGNDRYLNRAGGSSPAYPFSVVIDLAGDDTYMSNEDFAQGSGFFGGGFLVDLQGNDRYRAKNFAQGSGLFGIGMLADLAGHDQYSGSSAVQGVGSFGVGVLAEGGGNDDYDANFFAQGAGYVGGVGALVEAGGNDNYHAGELFEDFRTPGKSYVSMAQGYGSGMFLSPVVDISGGIGVLADVEGDDSYVADYFAQGAGYWFALGILDDRAGNDRYRAGRYAQGAGIHLSAGVLIDHGGDDSYLADYGVAQGCGHDLGIGMLWDRGGNDRYTAGTLSQGAGNLGGIGVLLDDSGDDYYSAKNASQGHGNFDEVRALSSFGLLFDSGGNDSYDQGGSNGNRIFRPSWGIAVDRN